MENKYIYQEFLKLAVVDQLPYSKISEILGLEQKELSRLWEEHKEEREALSKIRSIYKRKKITDLDFWDFHQWYTTAERKCHYCGINEEQIKKLKVRSMLFTTRLVTRGKSLEIERRQAKKSYDHVTNLTFCCYWCNNAKSDEFTEEEFKLIGPVISSIWKARLGNDY